MNYFRVTLDLLVKQAKLEIPDKWVKLESEAKRAIVDVEVLKDTEENSVPLGGREKWEKREKPEREVYKDQSDPKANRFVKFKQMNNQVMHV